MNSGFAGAMVSTYGNSGEPYGNSGERYGNALGVKVSAAGT